VSNREPRKLALGSRGGKGGGERPQKGKKIWTVVWRRKKSKKTPISPREKIRCLLWRQKLKKNCGEGLRCTVLNRKRHFRGGAEKKKGVGFFGNKRSEGGEQTFDANRVVEKKGKLAAKKVVVTNKEKKMNLQKKIQVGFGQGEHSKP